MLALALVLQGEGLRRRLGLLEDRLLEVVAASDADSDADSTALLFLFFGSLQ